MKRWRVPYGVCPARPEQFFSFFFFFFFFFCVSSARYVRAGTKRVVVLEDWWREAAAAAAGSKPRWQQAGEGREERGRLTPRGFVYGSLCSPYYFYGRTPRVGYVIL